MSRILLLTLMFGLFAACTNSSKPANDEDRVLTFKDFKEFFPEATSFRLNADSLKHRIPDTFALKAKVVKQFLPDTLAKGSFTAAEKPKFFPRAYLKTDEQQFFVVEGATKAGNVAWLCIYDKEDKFLQRHLVAKNTAANNNSRIGFSLDAKRNLRVTTEIQRAPGQLSTRDDVYATNPDGSLALIMTNSNEPTNTGLYNPIDTLPRKHKFSANYTSGEQNLVSIRDGETAKEFLFFIHFTRDNGECIGEMDGVGRFTTATTGQFRDKHTSCIVDFKFSSGKVSIKETGCGAYRGIKCFFEGTFTKRKK